MMKNFLPMATAALAAETAALPARAVTFEGALTQGATTVADWSATGAISFDVDFGDLRAATVTYRIDDADLGRALDFSAILRNYAGTGFTGYTIELSSGRFGTLGSATRQFGGTAAVAGGGGFASIVFSSPEYLDVEVGNALGTTAGAAPWTLAGWASGDRIGVTVTPVPEPGTAALWLAGLGAVGFVARRRRG